jgi:hypothetical protein
MSSSVGNPGILYTGVIVMGLEGIEVVVCRRPNIFDSHDLDEEEMDEADVEEKDQASIKKTTSTVDIRGSLPVVLLI